MGLPVKVIVLNNGTLGFVEMEMKASGFLDTGCDLRNPDFALMAEAMGVRGIRVENPQGLKPAIEVALAHKGPVLVDVVSARQEIAMPPKTSRSGLSLWDVHDEGGSRRSGNSTHRPCQGESLPLMRCG